MDLQQSIGINHYPSETVPKGFAMQESVDYLAYTADLAVILVLGVVSGTGLSADSLSALKLTPQWLL